VTYEQWDAVADSVNPIMAIATLVLPFVVRSDCRGGRIAFYAAAVLSMVFMYALGWVDQNLHIWDRVGLDYSTHSGFAAVLIVSIWLWVRSAGVTAAAIGLAYCALMLYQRYHTIADIVSTVVVISSVTLGIHHLRSAIVRRSAPATSAPPE
jgi:hypothetical protein